ncbi:MAG: DUF1476 domain-containing protein [Pseudomonadota bacterium]|nr:DUF1476 domain-containing protein [Pseudomonadota bacterium]
MAEIFSDRKNAHEAKYKLEQEAQFKVDSRRNKLLGLWLGERLGKTESQLEDYAKEVVISDLEEPGVEDVVRKVMKDIVDAGADITDTDIRAKLSEFEEEAREQILGDDR